MDAPGPVAAASDGGVETADAARPPTERPFASTPIEAQSLIQSQIDTRMKALWKCVGDYRTRKGDAHKGVVVDIGIDQEGSLIGVTSPSAKQELDPQLKDCVLSTLRGLSFPRSHSGVITVRQSFTDATVIQ